MDSFNTGLKVGEVARQAGVNLQTIRYYERRGLLPSPPRTASNYRAYPRDTVRRVRFIKRAKALGFTLKEIDELLSLQVDPQTSCVSVRDAAKAKVEDIDDKLRNLRAMRKALTGLIEDCSGEGPTAQCPILKALDSGDE